MASRIAGPDRFSAIDSRDYERLLQKAIRVEGTAPKTPDHPECVGRKVTRPVKTQIEIPYKEEVQVPVTKQIAHHHTKKKVVKGVELVPVQKFKEIEETHIEVREDEVTGYRLVWKQVKEPYKKIVKTPISVTKKVKVPYTDYEEREVEKVVEVPCDELEEQEGYRIDTISKAQVIDVEQDEYYELKPHLIGRGEVRVKASETHDLGCTHVGQEHFSGHSRGVDHRRPPTGQRPVSSMGFAVPGLRDGDPARPGSRAGTPRLCERPGSRLGTPRLTGTPRLPPGTPRPLSANSTSTARRAAERVHRRKPPLLPGDPPCGEGLKESRGPRVAVHKA